jgi:nicotinate-nucleotide pyrophosphorylase (carboxylating)
VKNIDMDWDSSEIADLLDRALQEDLGSGDITTSIICSESRSISAEFIAKQKGILAGSPLIPRIFHRLDSGALVKEFLHEGDALVPGTVFCKVKGDARAILSGERLALNFVQRLCGIATQTAAFVQLAKEKGIAVLDTRKTTPLLRMLEKYAVKTGGGVNHRFGLYDGILVKDNHLKLQADFRKLIRQFQNLGYSADKIEIEVTDADMLKAAMDAGGVWFLLDNMKPEMIRECVDLKRKNMKYEVSGGISIANFEEYLISGVDAISIGALTHTIQSLDISMEIQI